MHPRDAPMTLLGAATTLLGAPATVGSRANEAVRRTDDSPRRPDDSTRRDAESTGKNDDPTGARRPLYRWLYLIAFARCSTRTSDTLDLHPRTDDPHLACGHFPCE